MIPTAAYAARRATLARNIGNGVVIVATSPERPRNRDAHYPYRYDSYFYYLTGFTEPDAVLALVGGESPRSLLFCRAKNEEREIWDGFRYGPEAAKSAFAMDDALPIESLDAEIPKLLGDRDRIFFSLGADPVWDAKLTAWLNGVRGLVRTGVQAPSEVVDLRSLLDPMRLVKDAYELDTMRKAAVISAAAHRRAMSAARPGMFEYQIEAEILHEFVRSGSQAPAYTSIVASGANACVLHYITNRAELKRGDLLLIDAGCELDGYASDITRTFPVGGKFEGAQRALYEVVLASQFKAIEAVHPGNSFNDPHQSAVRVLVDGLIDVGLLSGDADGIIESGALKCCYVHGTGDWLGLDVHDAGEYGSEGKWKSLEPGMVLTVEPGLYVRAADDIPEPFRNIGIRIEDDVLVTAAGHEVITADAPKTIRDIEALVGHG